MVRSFEGLYRDGKVELLEPVDGVEEARVIVTFLPDGGAIDLASRGMSTEHAADLRGRLRTFAEDWERPEMDAYDAL